MTAAGSTARTDAKLTWAGCRAMPSAGEQDLAGRRRGRGDDDRQPGGPGQRAGQAPARPADQAQHQGVLADDPAGRRRDVQAEPGREAADRADRRAVGHAQRGHHHQHQVGHAPAGQPQPVDQGELEDERGGEQHRGQEEPAHAQPPGVGDGAVPPGAADPLAPGVTVTVTVGRRLDVRLGRQHREPGIVPRRPRSRCRRSPSAVKFTYGVTAARAVSAPARLLIELMNADRHAGHVRPVSAPTPR